MSRRSNINDKVLKLLEPINKKADLINELQTSIDPNIYFRRNSVNLLVGKKGSGKTYNVFREVLKLNFVPKHRYTKMLYVTDKPDDPTYTRIMNLMKVPVQIIPYEDAVEEIKKLAGAKAAMREMKEKDIDAEDLEDDARDELEDILGEDIGTNKLVYHSIVLLDDCQAMFEKRTRENRDLWKLLFENRQPKITYFLCCQDPKGIDTSLKEALDAVWVFGSFSRFKFSYLLRNIPHDDDPKQLWKIYETLSKKEAMLFLQNDDGIADVKIIRD